MSTMEKGGKTAHILAKLFVNNYRYVFTGFCVIIFLWGLAYCNIQLCTYAGNPQENTNN
jgi:hypothetical protein